MLNKATKEKTRRLLREGYGVEDIAVMLCRGLGLDGDPLRACAHKTLPHVRSYVDQLRESGWFGR